MAKRKKQTKSKKRVKLIGIDRVVDLMDKKVIKLLEDIKKLVILQLVKGGKPASTEEIGSALGITGRTVRNVATTLKKPRKKKSKKAKK